MGWELGFDANWNRWIGHGVVAFCDHPGCNEKIDRGLSYVCGGEPYGGEVCCGLYFCTKHLHYHGGIDGKQACDRCCNAEDAFDPKPEHPEWIKHLLTDSSWDKWRQENPREVIKLKEALKHGR